MSLFERAGVSPTPCPAASTATPNGPTFGFARAGEWADRVPRQRAVLESRHTHGCRLREPHGAVGRERQPTQPGDGRREIVHGDRAVGREARPTARLPRIRKPRGPINAGGETERLETSVGFRGTFSNRPSRSRPMAFGAEGEPHDAVARQCDADGDVGPGGHPMLDEFGIGHGTRCPISASAEQRRTTVPVAASQSCGRKRRRPMPGAPLPRWSTLPPGLPAPARWEQCRAALDGRGSSRLIAASDANRIRTEECGAAARLMAPSRERAPRPSAARCQSRGIRREREADIDGRGARGSRRSGPASRCAGRFGHASQRSPPSGLRYRPRSVANKTMVPTTAKPRTTARVRKRPADGPPSLAPVVAPEQLAAHDDPEPPGIGVVQGHRLDPPGRRRRGIQPPAPGSIGLAHSRPPATRTRFPDRPDRRRARPRPRLRQAIAGIHPDMPESWLTWRPRHPPGRCAREPILEPMPLPGRLQPALEWLATDRRRSGRSPRLQTRARALRPRRRPPQRRRRRARPALPPSSRAHRSSTKCRCRSPAGDGPARWG